MTHPAVSLLCPCSYQRAQGCLQPQVALGHWELPKLLSPGVIYCTILVSPTAQSWCYSSAQSCCHPLLNPAVNHLLNPGATHGSILAPLCTKDFVPSWHFQSPEHMGSQVNRLQQKLQDPKGALCKDGSRRSCHPSKELWQHR